MDVTVFDVMDLTPYTFLEVQRGKTRGNIVVETHESTGVFKLRSNFVRGENAETKESNATLHIRPEEAFLEQFSNNLIGHGIEIFDKQYEIVGQTGGMNYHNGVMEHYTVTLQETKFSDYGESS